MSETHSKNHDYHLVDPSPWPAIGAIAAFITAIGAVIYFHQGSYWLLIIGLIAVLYTMYGWWREVIKEANQIFDVDSVYPSIYLASELSRNKL